MGDARPEPVRLPEGYPWEGHFSVAKGCVWGLWIGPLLPFLFSGESPLSWFAWFFPRLATIRSSPGLADAWPILPWLLLLAAVTCLLLSIWLRTRPQPVAGDAATPESATVEAAIPSRFRVVRFPHWLVDMALVLSVCLAAVSIDSNQFLALPAFVLGCLGLWLFVLPAEDELWRRYLGDGYAEFAGRTGRILPRLPQVEVGGTIEYVVPQRFGMSAIIALVTMFAMIFGTLNLVQSQITEIRVTPLVHLFFGGLLMLVWIGQMRFAKQARMVSALAGAILLPSFVLFGVQGLQRGQYLSVIITLGILGAVMGYCMGAMAAGFFLFAAWIGPHLPGARRAK